MTLNRIAKPDKTRAGQTVLFVLIKDVLS